MPESMPSFGHRPSLLQRRSFTHAALLALAGCGGGGGGGGGGTGAPESEAGSTRPQDLPVIHALDGESWFQTLVGLMQTTSVPAIGVAVHTAGLRARDFVPVNACTSGGGGEGRFLDFLRQELQPFVAAHVGANRARQVLFGHSHGASLVLHALFAEPPGGHGFPANLDHAAALKRRAYGGLVLADQAYAGTHLGIVPQALADGIGFALAAR